MTLGLALLCFLNPFPKHPLSLPVYLLDGLHPFPLLTDSKFPFLIILRAPHQAPGSPVNRRTLWIIAGVSRNSGATHTAERIKGSHQSQEGQKKRSRRQKSGEESKEEGGGSGNTQHCWPFCGYTQPVLPPYPISWPKPSKSLSQRYHLFAHLNLRATQVQRNPVLF